MFATTLLNHLKSFQRCVDLETAVEIHIPVMQAIASIEQKEKYCLVSASIQSPWVEKWLHPVISTSALGRLSTHSSPKTTSHPFHRPVLVLTSQILMKIIDVYCPIQCSCDNLLQNDFSGDSVYIISVLRMLINFV